MMLVALIPPVMLDARSASAASTTVVISQFQVAGGGTKPPNDEFVELHNVSTSSIDLDGMRLVYRSVDGTTDRVLKIWSGSTPIPPGGYYLLGNITGYDGPAADATFGTLVNGELAAAGGGLALRLGAANSGTIIDSVGYGTATNVFVETATTAAPAANSARARGDSGCTDTDVNSSDFVELTPSSPRSSSAPRFVCNALPDLRLRKSATPGTYAAVGDVISYRYRVTNSGNVRLAGPIRVADDQVSVDCPAVTSVGDGDAYLDPGEELVCSASHTVRQADLNRGSITNTATATADGTTSDRDTVTVDAVQAPDLRLRKSATPGTYAAVGDVISYRYRVTNSGNVRLAGPVRVADDQVGVDCPAVTSVGDGDAYLDPGEELVCSASHTVRQADLNRGSITNTATATADGVSSPADRATVEAVSAPDLPVTVEAAPVPGLPCEPSSLTFSVPKGAVSYPMRVVSVTANGRLVDGCALPFSLASYRTQGPTWRTSGRQALIDRVGAILDNAQPSITLTVRTPRRYGQTVFYPGLRVYDGIDGPLPRYPDVRIDPSISWSNGPRGSDTRAPRMTQPIVRIAAGQSIRFNGLVPVTSRWTASDKRSGILQGTAQHRTLAGTWQTLTKWRGQPRATTAWLSPSAGPFHQRVRASDRMRNTSTWKAGPWFALRTLQGDGSDPITWSGSWKAVEGRQLLAGRAWRSSTPRDRLDVRLKGTNAALVATVGPRGGRIRVLVNGVKGPVIDLRSEVVRHRRIVWSSPLRGRQSHDISVVVLGRRGSAATDVTVQIDAVLAIRTLGHAWTHGSPGTDTTKRSEGS